MVMGAVRQFLKETVWGTQDFLIVDLPPGTGDAQLTLAQQVALDGVVIVTTPQDVALLDAVRAVKMFRQVHCPVLGIVENMSLFVCPDCGEGEELFGRGGGERMAAEEGTGLLARIPINGEIRESGDNGMPLVGRPAHPASIFLEIARQIVERWPIDRPTPCEIRHRLASLPRAAIVAVRSIDWMLTIGWKPVPIRTGSELENVNGNH